VTARFNSSVLQTHQCLRNGTEEADINLSRQRKS